MSQRKTYNTKEWKGMSDYKSYRTEISTSNSFLFPVNRSLDGLFSGFTLRMAQNFSFFFVISSDMEFMSHALKFMSSILKFIVDAFNFIVEAFNFIVEAFNLIVDAFNFIVDALKCYVDALKCYVDASNFNVDNFGNKYFNIFVQKETIKNLYKTV